MPVAVPQPPPLINSIFLLQRSPETETVPMYQENPVERRQAVRVLYHIDLEVAILVDIIQDINNSLNLSWLLCAPLNQHLIHC